MTAQLTVLSLGWGVQSWTLAAMAALHDERLLTLVEGERWRPLDFAIHADTTWEREQTYWFAEQMTPWLEARGVQVVTVRDEEQTSKAVSAETDAPFFTQRSRDSAVVGPHGDVVVPAFTAGTAASPSEIGDPNSGNVFAPVFTGPSTTGNGSSVNGQLRRQCTDRWKITPQRRYVSAWLRERGLKKRPGTVEKWLGISLDEWRRAKTAEERYIVHRYPLLDLRMTRADCIFWLKEHDLPVPPKSSCVFCPYHSKRAWQELKRGGGRDWEIALQIDTAIRDKRPPYPLYVHPGRKPLPEAVVIPEDFGSQQISMFDSAEDDDTATCDSGHCFL